MPLKLLVVGIYIIYRVTIRHMQHLAYTKQGWIILRHPFWINIFLLRISLITMIWSSILQMLC